jgi:beta-arrestin
LTRLQERLIKKLGSNAYPFFFELPPHCPASVSLQPAPGDTGKPCGVDYELKAFVGDCSEDKPHKRNSVRLAIRKVVYAPSKLGEQPSIEVSKEFMLKPNKIHLEASLDKEVKIKILKCFSKKFIFNFFPSALSPRRESSSECTYCK